MDGQYWLMYRYLLCGSWSLAASSLGPCIVWRKQAYCEYALPIDSGGRRVLAFLAERHVKVLRVLNER